MLDARETRELIEVLRLARVAKRGEHEEWAGRPRGRGGEEPAASASNRHSKRGGQGGERHGAAGDGGG